MLSFPQLATGALAQFPIERRLIRRTIVNRMPDGTIVKLDDPMSTVIEWTLSYRGLADSERSAIENLFFETEGRLRPFVFLDPAGNLLRWSEDLTKPVWQKDGALQVTPEVSDPSGTGRGKRLINAGQGEQSLVQSVDAPGWLRYCFSAWVRSDVRTRVELSFSNADGAVAGENFVHDEWRLVSCSGEIPGSAEDIACRLAIGAGASIEVYGLQLSAQANADTSRRTYAQSGVYTDSHFGSDELHFTAEGIDDHAVTVRVVSRTGSE
jgi:hypothetical protein